MEGRGAPASRAAGRAAGGHLAVEHDRPDNVSELPRRIKERVDHERWKQRSRKFTRKRDADRFDREQDRRRELGTLPTLAVRPVTLDEYVEQTWAPTTACCSRRAPARSTRGHTTGTSRPRLGGVAAARDHPGRRRRWQAALVRAGVGHDTLLKARTVLSAVLRRAVDRRARRAQPRARRRRPAAPLRRRGPAARPARRRGAAGGALKPARPRAGLAARLRRSAAARGAHAALGHVHERTLASAPPRPRAPPLGAAARPAGARPARVAARVRAPRRRRRRDPRARGRRRNGGAGRFNAGAATCSPPRSGRRAAASAPYDLRHSFASLLLHEGRSVDLRRPPTRARRDADAAHLRPRHRRARGPAAAIGRGGDQASPSTPSSRNAVCRSPYEVLGLVPSADAWAVKQLPLAPLRGSEAAELGAALIKRG